MSIGIGSSLNEPEWDIAGLQRKLRKLEQALLHIALDDVCWSDFVQGTLGYDPQTVDPHSLPTWDLEEEE